MLSMGVVVVVVVVGDGVVNSQVDLAAFALLSFFVSFRLSVGGGGGGSTIIASRLCWLLACLLAY